MDKKRGRSFLCSKQIIPRREGKRVRHSHTHTLTKRQTEGKRLRVKQREGKRKTEIQIDEQNTNKKINAYIQED